MGRRKRNNCDICGREVPKISTVVDGKAHCAACAKRELVNASCPECGKTVRIRPGTEPRLCPSCRTNVRFCAGCGRELKKASLVKENGDAFCYNCSIKFREPAPCAKCGKVTVYLTTSVPRGIHEKVCYACLDNHKKGTCPICRKFRILIKNTEFGRPACKYCVITKGSFICPICNLPGEKYSAAKCKACYLREVLEVHISAWLDAMPNGWVKYLSQSWASDFLHDLKARRAMVKVAVIQPTLNFFDTLAATCKSPEEMTLLFLFETFGNGWTNRYRNAFDFLLKSALVPLPDDQAYTDIRHYQRQLTYIKMASGTWFQNLLSEFHTFMLEIRERYQSRGWDSSERYQPRTISSNMAAAYYFLLFHKDSVQAAQELQEDHFYQFLIAFPGYRCAIVANFLYFLNYKRKTFKRITLKDEDGSVSRKKSSGKAKPSTRRKVTLSDDVYDKLSEQLYKCTPSEARDALIGLFALNYAQRWYKVVKMRLDAVLQQPDGKFHVRFASSSLEIDEETSTVLGMYMSQRLLLEKELDTPNPYLFPGSAAGSHLRYDPAQDFYESLGITANQVYATALIRLYQGGVTQPKVLMDGLGISAPTAMKYYERANVRIMEELREGR